MVSTGLVYPEQVLTGGGVVLGLGWVWVFSEEVVFGRIALEITHNCNYDFHTRRSRSITYRPNN